MHRPFQFRIRALLLITAIVACNAAVFRFGDLARGAVSTLSVAALTCCYFRLARQRPHVIAGLWGIGAAMAWLGGVLAGVAYIEHGDLLSTALAGLLGAGFGFYIGYGAVLILSLFPGPKLQ